MPPVLDRRDADELDLAIIHELQQDARQSNRAIATRLQISEGTIRARLRRMQADRCNDLGAEHLLADPKTWRLSAVIDWGDAAITDPAHDFGLLLRDLGSRALADVVDHYRRDVDDRAALLTRAVFYARCKTLEDLAYGLDAGRREYVDNGLAALTWLFDPDVPGITPVRRAARAPGERGGPNRADNCR